MSTVDHLRRVVCSAREFTLSTIKITHRSGRRNTATGRPNAYTRVWAGTKIITLGFPEQLKSENHLLDDLPVVPQQDSESQLAALDAQV